MSPGRRLPGPRVSPTHCSSRSAGDLDVDGVCVESALLERGHHVVRAPYGLPPIGGCFHPGVESSAVYYALDEVAGGTQPDRVYVHQGDRAVLQRRGEQDVRAQVAREDCAPAPMRVIPALARPFPLGPYQTDVTCPKDQDQGQGAISGAHVLGTAGTSIGALLDPHSSPSIVRMEVPAEIRSDERPM